MAGDLTTDFCPWCKRTTEQVFVAGHYQCTVCEQVVENCCEGPIGGEDT